MRSLVQELTAPHVPSAPCNWTIMYELMQLNSLAKVTVFPMAFPYPLTVSIASVNNMRWFLYNSCLYVVTATEQSVGLSAVQQSEQSVGLSAVQQLSVHYTSTEQSVCLSAVHQLVCHDRWVEEYHVDGFRFDLASCLCRDSQGNPLEAPPIIRDIAKDPVLSKVKAKAYAQQPHTTVPQTTYTSKPTIHLLQQEIRQGPGPVQGK